MLKETYLANLRNLPSDAIRVRVARPALDILNDEMVALELERGN